MKKINSNTQTIAITMIRLKKQLILFLCIFFSISGLAQSEFEIASVSYLNFPSLNFDGDSDHSFKSPVNIYNTKVNLPLRINDNNILVNSLTYDYIDIQNSDIQNRYPYFNDITTFRYGLQYFYKKKSWLFYFRNELKYGSDDYNEFGFNKTIFQTAAGAIKNIENRKLKKIGIGAGMKTDYGLPIVIPSLLLNMNFNNRLSFNCLLPFRSKLVYKATPDLNMGVNHFLVLRTCRLTKSPQDADLNFAKIQSINSGFFIEKRLINQVYLELNSGSNLSNSVRLFNNDNEEVRNYKTKVGYYVNFKLSLKLNRKENAE